MTRILLVSPSHEIVIHDIPIFNNSDVKTVEKFIQDKRKDYGEITRILFSMGDVRILGDKDGIPVPLQSTPRGHGR